MSAQSNNLLDWKAKGFAADPVAKVCGQHGLLLYRCWGGWSSKELPPAIKDGYFCLTKPASVFEAELKYNIADWGNAIRFVSTFRLKPGFAYFEGPVANAPGDLSISALQILVPAPVGVKVARLAREVLKQDVSVVQAGTPWLS
ncbi:hypothetical protein [Bradyrhizobium sp. 2TAF24]|uniref:hypothetical protein n=1 Tax=Bradyrhizobium sp. 2TAF24 TaxID=3233011 RepID=UPI003F931058